MACNLVHRSRVEQQLDDELRAYAEWLAAEKIRNGMPPDEARRTALLETGGLEQIKENVRDIRPGALFDVLARDLRVATRVLAKTPSFTAIAVIALGLGIGANTAILSVVDAVLLRPLAYASPERLGVILHNGRDPVSPANFADWRRSTRSYTDIAAAEYWSSNLGDVDEPERLSGLRLTAEMLPMLGVQPRLGRFFAASEDEPGRHQVVVIGQGLWQRRFGSDPSVIGKRILLDGESFTIVGVMPESFQFAPFWVTRAELWAPLALGDRVTGNRNSNSLRVFARLRGGVTFEQAREELRTLTAHLDGEFPGSNRNVRLVPLKELVVGDIRGALVMLLVAVSFVLLAACANVAHMLLARAATREKEIAVRVALGATRGRMIGQLLVESVLLDPGFDPHGLLTLSVSVAGTRMADSGARAAFYDNVIQRVRALPGVAGASYINHLPLGGEQWGFSFHPEGRVEPKPGEAPGAAYRVVFPDYFRTMRIPMLYGRDFSSVDRLDAPKVAIINEYMARKHWPGERAVGKRFRFSRDTAWVTVVGVSKNSTLSSWGAPPEEEMFFPFSQSARYLSDPASRYAYLTLVVRSSCAGNRCDAAALTTPVVSSIRTIERGTSISQARTMEQLVYQATTESRFYVALLSAFAAIAAALAAVGIYGVMSYSVSQRTNEMGIRIALGAERSGILRLIVGQGLRVAAAGAGVGVVGALLLTRLMSGLLYGVGATDPDTFVAVTLLLCAVAIVACYIPARRATRIDPLKALRSE